MGIEGEEASGEVTTGAAHAPQGNLEVFGFGDGVSVQEAMDGRVADDEGEAIGQLKAALAEGATAAETVVAEGGFVEQLEGDPGLKGLRGLTGPAAEQIIGAEPQVFGDEQPEADEIAGDLVGQQLSDVALQAGGIAGLVPPPLFGALGLDGQRRSLGMIPVEPFFCCSPYSSITRSTLR